MLTLPADVQLLILDYIGVQADLKALCETSRAGRELTLPRLYNSIKIVTWDSKQARMKQFARCIAAGAGAHLRFTRALAFELSRPPPEPECQVTGRLGWATSDRIEVNQLCHDAIDSLVLLVLEMFPKDCLRSFR
jgi:hypothetical protein